MLPFEFGIKDYSCRDHARSLSSHFPPYCRVFGNLLMYGIVLKCLISGQTSVMRNNPV
ncbi:unnamed protein product [Ixodes persulcatus]